MAMAGRRMELRYPASSGKFIFRREPHSPSRSRTSCPPQRRPEVALGGRTGSGFLSQPTIIQTENRRYHYLARFRDAAFSLLLALRFSVWLESYGRAWVDPGPTLPRRARSLAAKTT